MKTKYLLIILFLFVLVFSGCFNVSAQKSKLITNKSKLDSILLEYKNKQNLEMFDFMKLDIALLSYFPTMKEWKNIESTFIDDVSNVLLRYVDSMDVKLDKNRVNVKIYSKDNRYQSNNSYKLNQGKSKYLILQGDSVKFKLKENIEDADSFRSQNFSSEIKVKKNIKGLTYRVIIDRVSYQSEIEIK